MTRAEGSVRSWLVVAVILAIGISLGLAAPAAAQADEPQPNESVDQDTIEHVQDITIPELHHGGNRVENSPPSVRMAGDQMFWVVHWPASLLGGNAGDPQDDGWEYLGHWGSVDRNAVYLRTINQGTDQELTVNVVYYEIGEAERGNETVEVPNNPEVYQQQITLERGWSMAKIDLPRTTSKTRVTMWVDEYEQSLRWQFYHHSVATAQPIAINTWGDFLESALIYFLGPILVGGFVAGAGARRAIKRAGIGPQWGYLRWIVTVGLIVGIASFLMFPSVAELVVNLPWVISALVVLLFAAIILETYTTNVYRAGFFQPKLTATEGPDQEDMVDILDAEEAQEYIVRMDDNEMAVVRPGLLPFLSRVFGRAARLEGSKQLETAVELHNSSLDRMFFIDPAADAPIEYEPEGWTLRTPSVESWRELPRLLWIPIVLVGLPVGAYLAAGSLVFAGGGAAIAGVLCFARPTDGHARFDPAEGHVRRVFASMMYMRMKYEEINTWQEARERLAKSDANTIRQREEAISEQSASLVESMFAEDIDASMLELLPNEDGEAEGDAAGEFEFLDGESEADDEVVVRDG